MREPVIESTRWIVSYSHNQATEFTVKYSEKGKLRLMNEAEARYWYFGRLGNDASVTFIPMVAKMQAMPNADARARYKAARAAESVNA